MAVDIKYKIKKPWITKVPSPEEEEEVRHFVDRIVGLVSTSWHEMKVQEVKVRVRPSLINCCLTFQPPTQWLEDDEGKEQLVIDNEWRRGGDQEERTRDRRSLHIYWPDRREGGERICECLWQVRSDPAFQLLLQNLSLVSYNWKTDDRPEFFLRPSALFPTGSTLSVDHGESSTTTTTITAEQLSCQFQTWTRQNQVGLLLEDNEGLCRGDYILYEMEAIGDDDTVLGFASWAIRVLPPPPC